MMMRTHLRVERLSRMRDCAITLATQLYDDAEWGAVCRRIEAAYRVDSSRMKAFLYWLCRHAEGWDVPGTPEGLEEKWPRLWGLFCFYEDSCDPRPSYRLREELQ